MPRHERGDSTARKLVASLTQYTALVTDEYLQEFDNPYCFSDSTLHIYQTSWRLDQLPGIHEASRMASSSLHQDEAATSSLSIVTKKRRAFDDITDTS